MINLIAEYTEIYAVFVLIFGFVIAKLAHHQIGIRNWREVLRKELIIGVINDIVLAFICCLGVSLWSRSIGLALVITFSITSNTDTSDTAPSAKRLTGDRSNWMDKAITNLVFMAFST